ncbi:MAG: hypothetical protein OHK0038_00110 [Flammeovirgaceae bacterium]
MTKEEKRKEREALLAEAKRYQVEIIRQVEDTTEKVREDSKKLIFIVGGMIIAFGVVQIMVGIFSPSRKTKEIIQLPPVSIAETPPQKQFVPKTEDSPIVKLIKKSIAEFLLSLAKKTLQEALEKYRKEK